MTSPHHLFWTFAYLSWSLALSSLQDVFRMPNLIPSRKSLLISCPHTHMMVKVKWPGLISNMTSLPCFTRTRDVLKNRPAYCVHKNFTNIHISGCVAYQLTTCTHLSTLWSHWWYFLSFWSKTSWPKTVTTMEYSAWIAYGFLAVLQWFAVSSSEKPDEISLSLG